MSITQKETFSRWLPSIVAVLGIGIQFAIFSAWLGRLDQRVIAVEKHAGDAVVHMPLAEKFNLFVTRSEYTAKVAQRDTEFAELRKAIDRMGAKLDRLIERQAGQ